MEQKSFDSIKTELSRAITLDHINSVDPVYLKTDASLVGLAGILLQEQHSELRIIACVSRHLRPAEKNYSIMEIEALAIISSLAKFRHYLLGRHFKIITDHRALSVLDSKSSTNARVQRWTMALSEYDYEVLYQKGKLHEDVDCLSRAPIEQPSDEEEFEAQLINTTFAVPIDVDDWLNAYETDEDNLFMAKAEEGEDNLCIRNGLVYLDNKLYVPESKRSLILNESHDSNLAAHDGIEGTTQRLNKFFWPDMKRDVSDYVKKCDDCQRRKVDHGLKAGLMRQHEAYCPMEIVSFDFFGPWPQTLSGKKFIILAVDHFTRFVDGIAVEDQIAEKFVLFFVEFASRFGAPKVIVSDCAKQFDNNCLNAIRDQFGTRLQISASGYSQGNTICEKATQSVTEKLSLIVNNSSNSCLDWELALPMVLYSCNTKKHSSTGYSPFELLYGRRTRSGI